MFDHASGYHNFYLETEGTWRRKRRDLELFGSDGADGSDNANGSEGASTWMAR